MAGTGQILTIGSRNGAIRDLVPIFRVGQLPANLAAIALLLWMAWMDDGRLPALGLLYASLFWLAQYGLRPSSMRVSEAQARPTEAELSNGGDYRQDEADGRWWPATGYDPYAWLWPEKSIGFERAPEGVTIVAPRQVLEPIRGRLEWLAEKGWQGSLPHAVELGDDPGPAPVAWHARAPAILLAAIMVTAWFVLTVTRGDMTSWGLSAAVLAQGKVETVVLHMLAHGGLLHLVMNIGVLIGCGAQVTSRLGPPPVNWLRFLVLFGLSGLSGSALFLVLHPWGTVPMVGASGAIYGLVGLLIRLPHGGGDLLTFRSHKIRRIGRSLIQENLFLIALLGLMAWSSGSAGGLAWEAHLGGFLFGFFVGPKFLPRPEAPASGRSLVARLRGRPMRGWRRRSTPASTLR